MCTQLCPVADVFRTMPRYGLATILPPAVAAYLFRDWPLVAALFASTALIASASALIVVSYTAGRHDAARAGTPCRHRVAH